MGFRLSSKGRGGGSRKLEVAMRAASVSSTRVTPVRVPVQELPSLRPQVQSPRSQYLGFQASQNYG